MFLGAISKLVRYLLSRADLPLRERQLLTSCLLDKLAARPLHDMIKHNEEGFLLVNGRTVDMETARALRESARAALDNVSLKFIREQVERVAITTSLHKATSDLDNYFGKAAIFWGQQEIEHLKLLAGPVDQE